MTKKKILVVVDMQNDFVTGSLGSKEAVAIVPKVVEKVKNFDGEIYYTMDTHSENYMETQEGHLLPVEHCISDSEGWQLIPELHNLLHGKLFFLKRTFGSQELAIILAKKEAKIESIELIGLCTDICVVSNALLLKAFMPEIPIIVDSSCCAGVTPEKHEAALETMRSCQIHVI